jgi:nondiscriminating glutamyl-tRNA synthetase
MTVKTRFAPSPTGYMHLGNARTALFNALFAWQEQGVFLLRIEDTDQERSTTEFAQQLMQDLQWLGLSWQEGPNVNEISPPYYQAQRGEIYARYYQQLIDNDQAYPCFCSAAELSLSRKLQRAAGQAPRYAGTCAHLSPSEIEAKLAQGVQPTLRFRVPKNEKIIFTDRVRGEQQFMSDDIGDFIIRRADGTPAFFFCNAIDDALMQVTKALRGEDHLTNTPRQLMILSALNLPAPQYGHFSLILGHDGAPLSKRNGSMSIKELREKGWLSLAVVNYLARLGHSYTEDTLLSLEELARQINDQRLGHAPSRFDPQHLKHWQQLALSQLDDEQWWQWLTHKVTLEIPSDLCPLFINAVRPNVLFPEDAQQWAEMILTENLVWNEEAHLVIKETDSAFFNHALIALHNSQGDYAALVAELKQTSGLKGKKLFMPLRAALTGVTHGPEMAYLLPLIGIHRAEQRLSSAADQDSL